MASVFEGIGRTNAISNETSRLVNQMSDIRQEAIQRRGQEDQKAISDLTKRKLENELVAEEEKRAARNREVDLTTHPYFTGLPDEMKDSILSFYQGWGAVGPDGKGRMGDLEDATGFLEGFPEVFKQHTQSFLGSKRADLLRKENELREANKNGKDTTKLQEQVQRARQEYDVALAQTGERQSVLDEMYEDAFQGLNRSDYTPKSQYDYVKKIEETGERDPQLLVPVDDGKGKGGIEEGEQERILMSHRKEAYAFAFKTAKFNDADQLKLLERIRDAKTEQEQARAETALFQSMDEKQKKEFQQSVDNYMTKHADEESLKRYRERQKRPLTLNDFPPPASVKSEYFGGENSEAFVDEAGQAFISDGEKFVPIRIEKGKIIIESGGQG